MSLLAILFAFDAARWWHGMSAALWGAAILAFAAPQIAYAQETRGYTMLLAAMMACCAMLARMEMLGYSRRRVVGLFLAALAMLLTHYLGAALLLAMILYAALRFAGDLRRKTIGVLLLSLLIALVIWAPMLVEQLHSFSKNLSWMVEPTDGRWIRLLDRLATLPLRFFIQPATNPGPAAYGGVVLLILPALLLRKHPQMLIWCLILWINVVVMVIGDAARSAQALSILRYTLPAAAAAAMLAACAGQALPRRFRHVIPAVIVLGCCMSLPLSYNRDGPACASLPAISTTPARTIPSCCFIASPTPTARSASGMSASRTTMQHAESLAGHPDQARRRRAARLAAHERPDRHRLHLQPAGRDSSRLYRSAIGNISLCGKLHASGVQNGVAIGDGAVSHQRSERMQ